MSRVRVQSIVIQDGRVLFGRGKGYHFFVGGGLEEGEAPEQGALRELKEEANVEGVVLFRIAEPGPPESVASPHEEIFTFLVDIGGQVPTLGRDPEETDTGDQISLASIELVPLERGELFTRIDRDYFKALIGECSRRQLAYSWCDAMNKLLANGE